MAWNNNHLFCSSSLSQQFGLGSLRWMWSARADWSRVASVGRLPLLHGVFYPSASRFVHMAAGRAPRQRAKVCNTLIAFSRSKQGTRSAQILEMEKQAQTFHGKSCKGTLQKDLMQEKVEICGHYCNLSSIASKDTMCISNLLPLSWGQRYKSWP